MEHSNKITIALTFDKEINSWVKNLAKETSQDKDTIYIAGKSSIPHITLVQAHFDVKQNGKLTKVFKKIEDQIRAQKLYSKVPDLAVSSKATWTTRTKTGVYTGLYIPNNTSLQKLHNNCVSIIEGLGGKVTSAHGINYFPHLTLALLEDGHTPRDIRGKIKKSMILHSPNLVVGDKGVGGSLNDIYFEKLNPLFPAKPLNRNTDLGKR